MKIERTLKKVGGSVMVPIPAEILRELRWGPGLRVSVDYEDGIVRVEPAAERAPDDVAEFVARFTKMYDQAGSEEPRRAVGGWRTPILGASSSRTPCSSSSREVRRGYGIWSLSKQP